MFNFTWKHCRTSYKHTEFQDHIYSLNEKKITEEGEGGGGSDVTLPPSTAVYEKSKIPGPDP